METNKDSWLVVNIAPLIALLFIGVSLGGIVILPVFGVLLPEAGTTLLSSGVMLLLGYYFGSSKGSLTKTQILASKVPDPKAE